jgi:hypothetical protein
MMDASAERLNMLLERHGDSGMKELRSSVVLGLCLNDEIITVGPGGRAVAQSAITDLFSGLDSWVREVTGGRLGL